eukprot:gene13511-14922_t
MIPTSEMWPFHKAWTVRQNNNGSWVSFLQRGSDANDDSNGSNDTATDDLQIPSVDVENPDHGPPEPVALECGPQNDGAELRTTEAHDAKFL